MPLQTKTVITGKDAQGNNTVLDVPIFIKETGYFVDENNRTLSTDAFYERFEEELQTQLAHMQDTAKWEEFTENYEEKTLALLSDMMATSMTYDVLQAMLVGIESKAISDAQSIGDRAGIYGKFMEKNLLGLTGTDNSPREDIVREIEGDERRIEVKASTLHKTISVGALTVYGIDDSMTRMGNVVPMGMRGGGNVFERAMGGDALGDIRNMSILYKMSTKMSNLLLIMLDEIQKAGKTGVRIKNIQLFTILLFSRLKKMVEEGKVITISKAKDGYNKEKLSQKFTVSINIETEKAVAKLAELYARKTDITHLLHNLNTHPTKMDIIRVFRNDEFFTIQN